MRQTTQKKLKDETLKLLEKYIETGDEQAAGALKRFIGANFSHPINQEAYQLMEPLRKKGESAPVKVQDYSAYKKKQERAQTQSPDPVVVDEEGWVEEVPINVLMAKTPEEFSSYFDHDKEAMIIFAKESGLDIVLRKNFKEETIAEKILEAFKSDEEE